MLAALIIDAVVFGMIDVPELRRLHRVARVDFWIAVAAIVGVLSAGVLAGVVIGVVLSLVWLIYVATSPKIPLLSRQPGTQVFRDAGEHPDGEAFDGLIILRLDFGLTFATAEALEERVIELIDAEPHPRAVILDFAGVDFIDSQGSEKLREIHRLAAASDAELRVARLKSQVRAMLAGDGVLDQIGEDHVHGNVDEAVEAQLHAIRIGQRTRL